MRTSSLTARKAFENMQPQRVVRILLVEDCKSDVFLVERMLNETAVNCTYKVTDVSRLVDAFCKIDNERFDIVMLDLNLLDIDGVAAVSALKAQAPRLPIVVYSGVDDIRIKEKAIMCGASCYLVKGHESSFGLKHSIENAVS